MIRLAEACIGGACNPVALTLKLADCVRESHDNTRTAAWKIVLGQLSYLCNEGIGGSMEAYTDFDKERAVYYFDFNPSVTQP